MGENKQERFGAGFGLRAANPADGSGEARWAAGPGDQLDGVDGGAAQRSRPPDRGGHPHGVDSSVSLATSVSPATRDRDLEARRESGVSAGSGASAEGAASLGEGERAEAASRRRSARRHAPTSRSAKRTSRREERRPAGAVDVAVEDIDTFVVDCDRCAVRGAACADCVVSVLLGPPVGLVWDADERRAVDALAEAGMVPRLRLVPETDSRSA